MQFIVFRQIDKKTNRPRTTKRTGHWSHEHASQISFIGSHTMSLRLISRSKLVVFKMKITCRIYALSFRPRVQNWNSLKPTVETKWSIGYVHDDILCNTASFIHWDLPSIFKKKIPYQILRYIPSSNIPVYATSVDRNRCYFKTTGNKNGFRGNQEASGPKGSHCLSQEIMHRIRVNGEFNTSVISEECQKDANLFSIQEIHLLSHGAHCPVDDSKYKWF